MPKYRIVQVQIGEEFHYEVEKKVLWWWDTEEEFSCCPDGVAGYDPRRFDTKEQAEEYIKGEREKRTVVKIINND